MKNKLILLLLSTVVGLSTVFAASGKIRGRVLDDKTKEAIIGASVTIIGTNYGAATDVDGNFIILNVPTGTYTVRASLLGYGPVAISNIKVNEDLSSEVNFNLTSSEVQLGEVLITQDRPLINKNATNAVRIGTQEDIQKLPIRGVQAAIVLSPGVVQQNGNLYIRGSRSDEVGYYLEGTSTRNVRDGNNLTTVIPEALEEFQLQAGGFTAEYGGANAGIVRQSLRTGGQEYKVTLQAETDNFTPQNTKKLGTYSYGFSNYVLTVGGPVPGMKNVKFFVAGENEFQRDNQQRFWEGFTMTNLPNVAIPGDTVRKLEIKSGNIPGGMRNRIISNGTLTFDFNPFVVRLGGSFSYQRSQNTADPIADIFNLSRLGILTSSNALVNAKLTHILNRTTSYDVNVSYTDDRNKTFDPDHGDEFLKYNDSIANAKFGYQYRNYTSGPTGNDLYGFAIDRFGQAQTGFGKNTQKRIGASLDIISQVNSQHQLKVGASVEQYTVRRYTLNGTSGLLNYFRTNPDEARTANLKRDYAVGRNGGVNNYGYDWYGNEIDDVNDIDGPKTPQYIAAYIQDKIEYSDLIINVGVRLDYLDNDDFKFIDDPTTKDIVEGPDYPSVDVTDATYPIYNATGIAKSEAYVQISPRVGFSFPISERTVFFLQYGKYIQPPRLNDLYSGRGAQGITFGGQNFIPNPVGFDLAPIRNTSYEVGFRQQISENASIELNGFYKDEQGQIQIKRNTVRNGSDASAYNTLVNGDFVTTKGVEFSLTLRRISRIQAKFNYTFSDAQGTGSTVNSAVSSVESGTLNPTVISPLDFNNTHRGAINIDYAFGKDDGGPILQQLGTNLLFTFSSGHPYTRSAGSIGQQGVSTGALVESDARFSNPLESINASTTPWNFNFDMRLYKTIEIAGFQSEIYVYVQNLLNTKNVLNVYRRTGNAFDDGYLSNSELSQSAIDARGQGFVDLYTNANLVNGRHYRNVTGNNLFGTPRQIRFGMRVDI